jgi:hypothetical protein
VSIVILLLVLTLVATSFYLGGVWSPHCS